MPRIVRRWPASSWFCGPAYSGSTRSVSKGGVAARQVVAGLGSGSQPSVIVSPGILVIAGQPIGSAGLSGATKFPHLHFTVRRSWRTVVPFAPSSEGCSLSTENLNQSLWDPALHKNLQYRAGTILDTGFIDGAVTMTSIETETTCQVGSDPNALVA